MTYQPREWNAVSSVSGKVYYSVSCCPLLARRRLHHADTDHIVVSLASWCAAAATGARRASRGVCNRRLPGQTRSAAALTRRVPLLVGVIQSDDINHGC